MTHPELYQSVLKFFDMLDVVEETDSGKEFHPIEVYCMRAALHADLENTLWEMKHAALNQQQMAEMREFNI